MDNLLQQAVQNVNMAAILPPLLLSLCGMILLLVNAFMPRGKTAVASWLSILTLVATGVITVGAWNQPQFGFSGHVALDNFATFFNVIFLVAALLTVLISDEYINREGDPVGEYYPLILFTTAGAMFMASATDMMTLFLGLEVMSVSLYVLAGFFRNQVQSNEAGLKYFLLGAFSTGFLLYGMALLYGTTGTTNIADIGSYLQSHSEAVSSPMCIAGMILLSIGLLFKIAAAPFHMWTPDVYQGAPTTITAFMSAGPKAAAFAAFLRVMVVGLGGLQVEWSQVLWVIAVLTMIAGNFIAIQQQNLKRMLAYSSIAHAGYAMVGVVAANAIGVSGILFYMLAYTFMNIGAFAVLVVAGRKGEENLTLEGFAGFGQKRPWLAVLLTLFLFSLMGIPPTAGFAGKFYIFAGAVKAGYIWLAVIGVLNSAVSLYYYLRVMVYMYFRTSEEEFGWISVKPGVVLTLVLAVIGVLYMGIVPQTVMALAKQALF